MVQQRTIIQSGNNTLRGYEEEGVLTPASGLEEYFYIRVKNKVPNPGDNITLNILNNIPFIITSLFVFHANDTQEGTLIVREDANDIGSSGVREDFSIPNVGGSDMPVNFEYPEHLFRVNSEMSLENVNISVLREVIFTCKRVGKLNDIIL